MFKNIIFILILFAFFPPFQGFYVFAVYFVMHNQLCWPTKASYTVEMTGHDGPEPPYQGGGPTTIGGGDISKSTQNLISAMEEVSARHTAACVHAAAFTGRRELNDDVEDASFFFSQSESVNFLRLSSTMGPFLLFRSIPNL